MSLCAVCSDLLSPERLGMASTTPSSYPHHPSITSFLQAVDDNCHLCWQGYRHIGQAHQLRLQELKGLEKDPSLHGALLGSSTKVAFQMTNTEPEGCLQLALGLEIRGIHPSPTGWFIPIPALTFIPTKDLERFPERRNLPSSTGSAASLDQIANWLQECDVGHADCCHSPVSPEHRPARLIDIDRLPGMFCVVSRDEVDPADRYVALSHRWRKVQQLQLTLKNESILRQGMPINALPKILQDAVVVARRIGIHLIWIDYLCIIQQGDDRNDWAIESGRMDVIYQNAYCSFSADGASCGEDGSDIGLFFNRDPRLFARLELQSSSGDGACKGSWASINKDLWRTEVDNSPLNNRGWTFQERALAPCVAHFGRQGIFWECRKAFHCESFPMVNPDPSIFHLGRFTLLRQLPTRFWNNCDSFGISDFPSEHLPYEFWDKCIKEYTRREFTYSNDRLVAISGVARYVKDYIQDTYLAGMWRKRLAAELGWWMYPSQQRYIHGEEPPYYAPSFSWASVRGQIHSSGPFALGILVNVECVTLESGPESLKGDQMFCADVFGSSLRAPVFQLRVSGVLRAAKLRWAEDWRLVVIALSDASSRPENDSESRNKQREMILEPLFDFTVPDGRREAFRARNVYMMEWRYGPDPGEHNIGKSDLHGMLLMQFGAGRHQFRRVGWVFARGDEARLLHESSVEEVLPACFDRATKKHTVYML